jgi:2-polyprenyl-3-methyl-5-hydroxy-6-metoxy-1,4-benzoquinol methylase
MMSYHEKQQGYFGTPRREMLAFIPEGITSVLEIGCGTGAFGALVKEHRHCHYTGVELMEQAASQARTRLDEVVVANIEHTPLPFTRASYDCLVCNDVLEHLVDPWRTLKDLIEFVRPSGYIIVSLPNVRFSEVVKDLIFRKRWQYKNEGVLDRTHLRFFTKESINGLMESAGLEVLELRGINPIQYAWRLRLLNIFLFGLLSDMRYPQYGCLAKIKKKD